MNGSYYKTGILFAGDDIRQPRFSIQISLSSDDWLKFKKAPAYQELMNWLEESEIPCRVPQQVEPGTAESRGNQRRHPVLQLIAPVVSSILTTLLTMKLLGIF